MKSAIYSPYLDALGGGERYIMSVAELLLEKGSVDVFWDDQTIKPKLIDRFNLSLENLTFQKNIFDKNSFTKYLILKDYDTLIYLSDGSFPYGFAKENIMHIQTPLIFKGQTLQNKLKLATWQHVVCNSAFTKQSIDQSLGIHATVIYPPVPTDLFQSAQKQNVIISVGRFFGLKHGKKQEKMIEWFKKLYDAGQKDWQLWLIGSVFSDDYYRSLEDKARDYPITLYRDISFTDLVALYAKAKIYWQAQGFEETEPKYMEHFGMTTVEAMASGCVPVVIGNGGQTEIVENGKNGVLWNSEQELLLQTEKLMNDMSLWQSMSDNAKATSEKFSKMRFREAFQKLL